MQKAVIIVVFALAIILGFGGFCLLAFHPVEAYEIPFETNKTNHCVIYSCQLADHINDNTNNTANVIGLQMEGIDVRHFMVLVNHKQPDCYLIESYTGEEFRTKQELTQWLSKYRVFAFHRTPPYAYAQAMVKKFAALNR